MNELKVSVVIPARDEARYIGECLDSVVSQDYPKRLTEVLVVDGMSTDRTREIVQDYGARHPFLTLLSNPNKTAPSGVNVGIRHATGEIVVRLDAHSSYPPDYVRSCVALLESTGAGNAGGRFVPVPNGPGAWARPILRVTSHRFGVGGSAFRTRDTPGFVDTVPYGTFRRKIFAEVGLFDERLTRNQDNELNARIIRAGYKIAYDPNIRIIYKNKGTLPELCGQAFYTGLWNVYTLRLHPHAFRARHFVPALFVIYLATLAAASGLSPAFIGRCALPLAAYAFLSLFFALDRRCALAENMRTAATFWAYHVCYGVGSVFGAANVLTGRWRRHLGRSLSM